MKRLFLIALGLIPLMGISYFAQSAAIIEGVVLNETTGEPLADVHIGLSTTGVTPIAFNPGRGMLPGVSATTDMQGRFSLSTTQSGRFRLVPSKNAYIFSRAGKTGAAEPGTWVQLAPGTRIQNLELRMTRPGVVRGQVLDSSGQPLVGTAGSVSLMRYTYGDDGNRLLGWVPGIVYPGAAGSFQRPDDRGEFRFYDVPPGEYYLQITGGGAPIGSHLYFYPGTSDELQAAPVVVQGGSDIQLGTLRLPERSGKEVKLIIHGPPESLDGSWEVRTRDILISTRMRSPGEFLLPRVAAGHYEMTVRNRAFSRPASLLYGRVVLDVTDIDVVQEVEVGPGAAITATILLEDENGNRSPAPSSMRCQLRSRNGLTECDQVEVVPDPHQILFPNLPADVCVLSVRSGDHDLLAEGLDISSDMKLEIVLRRSCSSAQGTVRDSRGEPLPDAVVAIVPDEPYRGAGPLYRAAITDRDGRFKIQGIAPGTYKLFAWSELEGAAYRNAEFLKEFEDRGVTAKVEQQTNFFADLRALEDTSRR